MEIGIGIGMGKNKEIQRLNDIFGTIRTTTIVTMEPPWLLSKLLFVTITIPETFKAVALFIENEEASTNEEAEVLYR